MEARSALSFGGSMDDKGESDMVKSLKIGVLLGLLGGAGLAAAPAAHADRVLTEHEAGKLTFNALIAPPSAFHHVTRKSPKSRGRAKTPRLAGLQHNGVTLRNVAYHGRVISRHRRNTHHRRG